MAPPQDDLLAYCLSLPGAWPDDPFGSGTLAKVGTAPGKIFAFPGEDAVVLKGRPEDLVELRAAYPDDVGKAAYLSAKHWVRVALGGAVPADEVRELVRGSHALVVAKLPRAQRPG